MAHLVIVVTGGDDGDDGCALPNIYSVWDESEPVKALVESRTAMVFINLPEYREGDEDEESEESEDADEPAGDEERKPGEPAGDKKRKREEPAGDDKRKAGEPEESAGESAGESDVIKILADMINKWLHSDGLPISNKMFGTFKNSAGDLEDAGFAYVTIERDRGEAPVIFVYAKIPKIEGK